MTDCVDLLHPPQTNNKLQDREPRQKFSIFMDFMGTFVPLFDLFSIIKESKIPATSPCPPISNIHLND